jgi:hypothetical protein
MRRLRLGQRTTLVLDRGLESIECRVLSVNGGSATMIMVQEPESRDRTRLAGGSMAFLGFEHQRHAVGLRGAAIAAEGNPSVVEFAVLDGVQIPQRRLHERLPCHVAALLRERDGATLLRTSTIDLSLGGVLLACQLDPCPTGAVEVQLWLAQARPLTLDAVVVRRPPDAVAVAFDNVSAAARDELDDYLAGLREQIFLSALARA